MVRVFRDAGYQVSREFADGVLHLEFDIDPTERSMEVRDAREQRAEARSVHNVLHPRSVAVIGASTDPTKIGHAVLLHLLRGNFAGPVYPVNPEARSVRGVRAYPAVTDIPDDVDLAVVAVPAAGMGDVMDSCLAKGVKALVVVSAGFADAGPDGRERPAPARRGGPGATGCGWSGRTRWASRTPTRRCGSNATLAPTMPGGRPGRVLQPVRRARHHAARRGRRARAGPVDVRLRRQPRRPVGQRRAAVLADRPGHGRRAALPGVVRQPAQVRPAGPPARPHQADHRGEERPAGPRRRRRRPRSSAAAAPVDEPGCRRCSSTRA